MRWRVAVALAAVACASCRSPETSSKPPQTQASQPARSVGWRTLGSWSGSGNLQTTSFETATGQLRIRWRAVAQGAGGTLRLSADSAISGRTLQVALDRDGPGEGTAYASLDPHDMYIEVESKNLDWSFTVEEAVSGTVDPIPSAPAR